MVAARFEVQVSKASEWSSAAAAGFVQALFEATDGEGFDLGVRADRQGVRFIISLDKASTLSQPALESLLRAYYPSAQIKPYEWPKPAYPFYRGYVAFARTNNPNFAFITSVTEVRSFDPLTVVTQTMNGLEPEETLWYAVRVEKSERTSDEEIKSILTVSAYDAGERARLPYLVQPNPVVSAFALLLKVLGDRNLKKQRVNIGSEAETRDYEAKLKQRLAHVDLVVAFTTPHKARLDLLSAVSGAVCNLVTSGATRLVSGTPQQAYIRTAEEDEKYDFRQYFNTFLPKQGLDRFWLWLTADEVAALWHVPHAGFAQQPLEWVSGLSPQLTQSRGKDTIQIGTVGRDEATPIYLSREDRQYHTYATGKTGMGKSTLLENLIKQDVEAGEGVAVMDPTGLLIKDVLSHCIPANRLDNVILLTCGDEGYPVPINPFHIAPGVSADEQLQALLWLMKTLYKEHWSTTRMETTLRNILQVVLADSQATPLDIQEVIENPKWRKRLLADLKAENRLATSTQRFWERFEDLSPSVRSEQVQPVLNRLGFLGSAHLERITCHPQTVDFRQLMREKKIVLIDLSGSAIASEVKMLGAIFLFNLYFASQSLFFSSQQKQHPFYLYADEVHEYVSTDLSKMLTESRKFGLWVTLANQYIGKLDEEAQAAIKGTVGTKVSFELGEEEAVKTAKLYEPEITAQEIAGLGVGNAVLRTRYGGETLKPFIIHTLPPPHSSGGSVPVAALVERSRQNLRLIPALEVSDWIRKRYRGDEPQPSTGLTNFE